MKHGVILASFGWAAVGATLWAQEPSTPKNGASREVPPAAKSEAPATKDRAALEREFADLLTGATLRGMWQMTGEGGLTGKDPLTEPKTEAYHIVSAAKLSDSFWLITARIEVGEKDVTVPVPVRVEWAGDTPVITLDDIPIPTMGTYSARVMFFRGFYSGTWLSNAKNYGGIMAGRIMKEAPAPTTKTPAAQEERPAGGNPP